MVFLLTGGLPQCQWPVTGEISSGSTESRAAPLLLLRFLYIRCELGAAKSQGIQITHSKQHQSVLGANTAQTEQKEQLRCS